MLSALQLKSEVYMTLEGSCLLAAKIPTGHLLLEKSLFRLLGLGNHRLPALVSGLAITVHGFLITT